MFVARRTGAERLDSACQKRSTRHGRAGSKGICRQLMAAERSAGLLEKRAAFSRCSLFRVSRGDSSGSHVSPEVAGERGQPPALLVDFSSSAVAIAIIATYANVFVVGKAVCLKSGTQTQPKRYAPTRE